MGVGVCMHAFVYMRFDFEPLFLLLGKRRFRKGLHYCCYYWVCVCACVEMLHITWQFPVYYQHWEKQQLISAITTTTFATQLHFCFRCLCTHLWTSASVSLQLKSSMLSAWNLKNILHGKLGILFRKKKKKKKIASKDKLGHVWRNENKILKNAWSSGDYIEIRKKTGCWLIPGFCNSITSPCSGLGGRGQCAVAFLMRWKTPGPEDSSTESDIVDKELVAIKNHKVSGSKKKSKTLQIAKHTKKEYFISHNSERNESTHKREKHRSVTVSMALILWRWKSSCIRGPQFTTAQ